MNKTERPFNYYLTIKGLIERITLLPLNYTRYNMIIILYTNQMYFLSNKKIEHD